VTRRPPRGAIAFSATSPGTVRYYDDTISDLGYVKIDDCLAVTAVSREGTTIPLTYTKLYPYNELPATRLMLRADAVFNELMLFDTSTWYNYPFKGTGAGQVAITGTWGFCTSGTDRPAVVKEATLQLATLYFQRLSITVSDLLQAMGNPHKKAESAIMTLLSDAGLVNTDVVLFA
jgi:hypothetical protein